jgi:hypothetical protein
MTITNIPRVAVGSVLRRADGRRFLVRNVVRCVTVPVEVRKAVEPLALGPEVRRKKPRGRRRTGFSYTPRPGDSDLYFPNYTGR